MNLHVLLIDCTDKKGLINKITSVLLKHSVNIEVNDEFADHSTSQFFMRTEFSGTFDSGQLYDDLLKILPEKANIKLRGKHKKNVLIMATKEHHCLGDILLRNMFNELNINISAIISNHQNLKELTERFKVPFHYVSDENLARAAHEKKILKIISDYNPEYLILAKYMRILSAHFTEKFKNKAINIHHSFLPAFIGANPYKQAYNRGVKIIGATAHFITQELDEGPIIFQNVINVNHSHNAADMARAGHDVEQAVLSKAVQLVMEDRVIVHGNKTIVFD